MRKIIGKTTIRFPIEDMKPYTKKELAKKEGKFIVFRVASSPEIAQALDIFYGKSTCAFETFLTLTVFAQLSCTYYSDVGDDDDPSESITISFSSRYV